MAETGESKMNIAFITPEFLTEARFDGGLANYLNKISQALTEKEYDVYIIVSSDRDEVFKYNGVTVIRVNMQSKFLKFLRKIVGGKAYTPLYWLFQSRKLNKELDKLHKRITIDIAQFTSLEGTAFFKSNKIVGVARISSYTPMWDLAQDNPADIARKSLYHIERRAMKKSDALYGPSRMIAKIIRKEINKDIEIIESPLSAEDTIIPNVYNDALVNKKYLLFFGTICLHKGTKEIGDIIYELLEKHKELFFVFVGKNRTYLGKPMIDYIWKQADIHRGRCLYLGSMRQELLRPIIDNAEAVILPSRVDNFPNTCIESMAMGQVVVGTRGASFEQLINNGENGFLCEKENSVSLAETIERVLALDSERKKSISENAVKTVQRLKPSLIVDQLELFYRKAIDNAELSIKNNYYEK